jgi:hypothetical protein
MKTMNSKAITLILIGLLIIGAITIWVLPGKADKSINTDIFGVAIKGYDPVAYFTERRAVKGNSEFTHIFQDARWHFLNDENRELFVADPEHYMPQYGGF